MIKGGGVWCSGSGGGSSGVQTINGASGDIDIQAGQGININTVGDIITISSTTGVLLTSSNNFNILLEPGKSITVTLTWLSSFVNNSYLVSGSVYDLSSNNIPLILNPISGSKSTTTIDIQIINIGNLNVDNFRVELFGR